MDSFQILFRNQVNCQTPNRHRQLPETFPHTIQVLLLNHATLKPIFHVGTSKNSIQVEFQVGVSVAKQIILLYFLIGSQPKALNSRWCILTRSCWSIIWGVISTRSECSLFCQIYVNTEDCIYIRYILHCLITLVTSVEKSQEALFRWLIFLRRCMQIKYHLIFPIFVYILTVCVT